MGKIICKCGGIISISEIPNEKEWLMISDIEFDKYSKTIDIEKLYMKMISLFLCKNCSRIWIFWNGFDESPSCYLLCDDNE